jgi:hypothetical protein
MHTWIFLISNNVFQVLCTFRSYFRRPRYPAPQISILPAPAHCAICDFPSPAHATPHPVTFHVSWPEHSPYTVRPATRDPRSASVGVSWPRVRHLGYTRWAVVSFFFCRSGFLLGRLALALVLDFEI